VELGNITQSKRVQGLVSWGERGRICFQPCGASPLKPTVVKSAVPGTGVLCSV
jgi:hypothetical protein